jgi:hypothetical protein
MIKFWLTVTAVELEWLLLQLSSNYLLAKKSTIRRQFIAAVLLMIFSFSITPKKFLHDAIATHKDKIIIAATDNTLQISHTAFACKADNLVAESPFTEQDNSFDFSALSIFSEEQSIAPYHFYSADYFFFELRGPPLDLL